MQAGKQRDVWLGDLSAQLDERDRKTRSAARRVTLYVRGAVVGEFDVVLGTRVACRNIPRDFLGFVEIRDECGTVRALIPCSTVGDSLGEDVRYDRGRMQATWRNEQRGSVTLLLEFHHVAA